MFRYITHDTSDLRYPFILIHKWFLTFQGGDIATRKLFLAKEEWFCQLNLLPRSARCSGCLQVLDFGADYDVEVWITHRDSCSGIEKRMMIAVAKTLEFPAGDMDEYDSDEAYHGREDQWQPVNECVPNDKWCGGDTGDIDGNSIASGNDCHCRKNLKLLQSHHDVESFSTQAAVLAQSGVG
ncbi:hypothetical protein DFS33DRAFT_1401189 [Desarmillaria ectypa]|nr:hypothetical protein DFS33DRAFT_1401189 [Desarmillaria ectypa]